MYICIIIGTKKRSYHNKISFEMKTNKLVAVLMALTVIVVLASCASRKYGCPSVSSIKPAASTKA